MKITNRIARQQPDYLFMIVQRPPGWSPKSLRDVPPFREALSIDYVASGDEAIDDVVRCNRFALEHGLNRWAVIESGAGGEL
jgi:hypothetical protein